MPPTRFKITVSDIDRCQQYATFLQTPGPHDEIELLLSEAFLKKHPIYSDTVNYPDLWHTSGTQRQAAAKEFTAIATRSLLDTNATLESHLINLGPNRPGNLTPATFVFVLVLILLSQFLAERLFAWTAGPKEVSDATIAKVLNAVNDRW